MVKKAENTPAPITNIERIVNWVGSVPSIIFHTFVFIAFFILTISNIFPSNTILLVWNTIVSLEAIYLALFIQNTVNRNTRSLASVEVDIDEIQEDVDEIQEDVEDLGEDLGEIQEDIEEMSEDLEELSEEDVEEERQEKLREANIDKLAADIRKVLQDIESLNTGR
jgi:low affinity Fe/Cu permease